MPFSFPTPKGPAPWSTGIDLVDSLLGLNQREPDLLSLVSPLAIRSPEWLANRTSELVKRATQNQEFMPIMGSPLENIRRFLVQTITRNPLNPLEPMAKDLGSVMGKPATHDDLATMILDMALQGEIPLWGKEAPTNLNRLMKPEVLADLKNWAQSVIASEVK
jgi:hypothetical protein